MLQKFGVYLLSFNTFEFYFLDLVTLFGGLGLDGFFELLVDFCAFFGFFEFAGYWMRLLLALDVGFSRRCHFYIENWAAMGFALYSN